MVNFISIGTCSAILFRKYQNKDISANNVIYNMNLRTLISEKNFEEKVKGLEFFKLIKNQLSKEWLSNITEKTDYIVIDLFDERLDCLSIDNQFLTKTPKLKKSKFQEKISFTTYNNIFDNEWKKCCKKLIELLAPISHKRNIILHEVYLATTFKKENQFIDFPNKEEIEKQNSKLREMYNYFKELNPEMVTIKLDNKLMYADDSKFKSPYMLSEEYFDTLSNSLFNTFDKEQEFYKLAFNIKCKLLNESENIAIYVEDNYINLMVNNKKRFVPICRWSDQIEASFQYRLPILKNNGIYFIGIDGDLGNIDLKVKIKFIDVDGIPIHVVELDKDDYTFQVPHNTYRYEIYLYAQGEGTAKLNYLKLMRSRNQGYVTSRDLVKKYSDSEDVHYLYEEENNSEYLAVAFHGFNTFNMKTNYEMLGILKDVPVSRLFILDDYDLNGRFYLDKDRKDLLQKNISNLIMEKANKLGISKDKIITVGASKGGSAALYYGLRLSVGNIISVGPPIYLSIYNSAHPNDRVFYKSIAGGFSKEDDVYMDKIMENVALLNDKTTHIHFFGITEDRYYKGYFDKYASFLNEQGISYSLMLQEGEGHHELPQYIAPFIYDKLKLIFE